MDAPTRLLTWAFPTDVGAQRAARRLGGGPHPVAVDDVAVVSWPADRRRPLAWQARELAVTRRLSGAFWGLLFAQLFLLPLSVRAGSSPQEDHGELERIDDALTHLGMDADYLRAVRDGVVHGTSALFVLEAGGDGAAIGARLPAEAVELPALTLTPQQADRLHAAFDDDED